jgi:hypothetical protein
MHPPPTITTSAVSLTRYRLPARRRTRSKRRPARGPPAKTVSPFAHAARAGAWARRASGVARLTTAAAAMEAARIVPTSYPVAHQAEARSRPRDGAVVRFGRRRRRTALPTIAGRLLWALALLQVIAGQAPRSQAFVLGAATVVVPPPDGFEDILGLPGVPERFPGLDGTETLAVHLPVEVARRYQPEQDLTFYTRAAVLAEAKTEDVSIAVLDGIAKRFASGEVPDQKKKLAEYAERSGILITEPVNLGLFDRTPQSFSGLIITTVGSAEQSDYYLLASSMVLVKARAIHLFAIRRLESEADRPLLEAFTRAWVRRVIAANP